MSAQAVAVVEPRVGARQKQALAGAWLVSAATLGSGVLTYAFHVLAARTLGADAYGKVAVLWAAMFLAAVVLYRPVEQTISRALADRMTRGEEVRSVLRTGGLAGAAAIVLPVAAVLAGRNLVGDRLFEGDRSLATMLAVGIALYGVAYFGRGVFGGMRWFPGYATALLADTAGRFLLAVPLVVVASTSLAAASVSVGGIAGILLPAVVGRARLRRLVAPTKGEPFALAAAARFAAPAALIAAADQLLVNGGPLLVVVLNSGSNASKTAGVVFAATMLVRVPVFVFQGLAASLLPNLTHLHANGDVARFRRAVASSACVFLGIGVVIVAGAAAIGPEALRTVYGPGFEAGRGPLALLGAGVGCYLAASTLSQALLARASTARAARAWAVTAAVFVGLYAAAPGAPLLRIAIAFSSAALVSLVLLAAGLAREVRR